MTGLLLQNLEIKNFRALQHLTIERLGRVNLVVGKNNVGKSSLLEALWLYAEKGAPSTIWDILERRKEGGSTLSTDVEDSVKRPQYIRHLFHQRDEVRQCVKS